MTGLDIFLWIITFPIWGAFAAAMMILSFYFAIIFIVILIYGFVIVIGLIMIFLNGILLACSKCWEWLKGLFRKNGK